MRHDHRGPMGTRCENLAAGYLAGYGLTVLARNHRSRLGEIDLICEHGATIVFVEVKARGNTRFGEGLESVTRRKQQTIRRIASGLMARFPGRACRFDVVTVAIDNGHPIIRHLVDVF